MKPSCTHGKANLRDLSISGLGVTRTCANRASAFVCKIREHLSNPVSMRLHHPKSLQQVPSEIHRDLHGLTKDPSDSEKTGDARSSRILRSTNATGFAFSEPGKPDFPEED